MFDLRQWQSTTSNSHIVEMDSKTSIRLIKLLLNKNFDSNAAMEIPLYKIAFNRSIDIKNNMKNLFDVDWNIDENVIVFLTLLSTNPSHIVVYLYWILQKSIDLEINSITLADICSKFFPMGFIKESHLFELWSIQKGDQHSNVDNYLDTQQVYDSIKSQLANNGKD
jgi:hypothetical protein